MSGNCAPAHAIDKASVAYDHEDRRRRVEGRDPLHRLREVLALTGFTRFEAVTPDINGEYETDVERALERSDLLSLVKTLSAVGNR